MGCASDELSKEVPFLLSSNLTACSSPIKNSKIKIQLKKLINIKILTFIFHVLLIERYIYIYILFTNYI